MIEHCSMDQMWMDINTKPKQGAAFCKFRAQVMGIPIDYVDSKYVAMIVSMRRCAIFDRPKNLLHLRHPPYYAQHCPDYIDVSSTHPGQEGITGVC